MKKRSLKVIAPLILPLVTFFTLIIIFNLVPRLNEVVAVDYMQRIEEIIGYILLTAIWLIGGWVVNRFIDIFLFEILLKEKAKLQIPTLIKNVTRSLVYFLAVLGIVGVVYGKTVSGLLTATGAVGIVVGFALKSMISDVFDGVSLSIDKPFKPGDFIHFHDSNLNFQAHVLETTWRTTRFRCSSNGILIIPNSKLCMMAFTNLTTSGKTFFELFFKVDINTPIEKIKTILFAAAKSAKGVMEEPAPEVVIDSIDQGNIRYKLMFAFDTKTTSQRMTKDAVSTQVIKLLGCSEYSLSLDKQQYVIRRFSQDDEAIVPLSPQAFLSKVPLFKDLYPEEKDKLIERLELLSVQANASILTLGEKQSSLFIVKEGLLSVHIPPKEDQEQLVKVAYLTRGDFFGEMSLLTGSSASATIKAETSAVLYRIDKPILAELFEANPKLVKHISMTIAKRQAENLKRKNEILTSEALNAETQTIAEKLVSKICDFFHIKT